MTKTTRKLCFVVLGLVTAGVAQAEWNMPTAGEMAKACRTNKDTADGARTHFALCSTIVKGFMDGYRRGAARGLRTGFTGDAKNLATIQGVSDAQNRIAVLGPRASCLPAVATTDQVEQVLLNYVESHPTALRHPYPEVLSDAIEEYFCPDR